jgi:thymidylate synthase
MIKGKNINDVFIDLCKLLNHSGKLVCPRGMPTKEIQNCLIEFNGYHSPIITVPERKLSNKYLEAEMQWYMKGNPDIDYIHEYSTFWKKLGDQNNTVNSNYGKLALIDKYNGLSQFEWCVEKLSNDLNTRQAVINYNQPQHKYGTNKDFVCTLTQQFILNDNKLDTIVMMRSNDLIYGFSYDVPWFNSLQKQIAQILKIEVGQYRHFATSMHVYERHFEMIKTVASAYHAKRQIK